MKEKIRELLDKGYTPEEIGEACQKLAEEIENEVTQEDIDFAQEMAIESVAMMIAYKNNRYEPTDEDIEAARDMLKIVKPKQMTFEDWLHGLK